MDLKQSGKYKAILFKENQNPSKMLSENFKFKLILTGKFWNNSELLGLG